MQNKEKRNGTYKPEGNKQGDNSGNVAHDDSSDDALVVTFPIFLVLQLETLRDVMPVSLAIPAILLVSGLQERRA